MTETGQNKPLNNTSCLHQKTAAISVIQITAIFQAKKLISDFHQFLSQLRSNRDRNGREAEFCLVREIKFD